MNLTSILALCTLQQDGVSHPVDSNDRAFRAAAKGAFKQAFANAQGQVLEPVMSGMFCYCLSFFFFVSFLVFFTLTKRIEPLFNSGGRGSRGVPGCRRGRA